MPVFALSTFPAGRLRWLCITLLFLLLAGGPSPVRAGGPVLVTSNGRPYRWDASQPVQYAIDQGRLSSRSHATAVAMIQQAWQAWQSVPTAALRFESAGELSEDVTGRNVLDFLNGVQDGDPSPIFLDSDGSITNALVGQGASDALLGFSSPYLTDPRTGQISVSFGVINGRLHDQYSDAFLLGTFTHELGHFVNMAHSQVNAQLLYDGDPTNDGLSPVMFYRGPNDSGGLSYDDRAWLTWLYPGDNAGGGVGMIRGQVLLPDGVTGARGIQVVARRVGDPLATAVGSVSGFLFQNGRGGLTNPNRLGEFLLPNLPPGSYTLEVEQVSNFPAIPVPLGYLIGGHKFWHEGSSTQDQPTASTPLTVSAGQDVSNILIVLNGGSLGALKPVAKKGPNALPNAQAVDLPAVITGTLNNAGAGDSPGASAGPAITSEKDLQDVYQVDVTDPVVVTAILSAASTSADLDLYVLAEQGGSRALIDASIQRGTPPEVVQLRLMSGRYYFGIHRSGALGSDYTLQLLASPAPDPDPAPDFAAISYLLVGSVTTTGAVAQWHTTADSTSVLYYHRPQREIGSTQLQKDHVLAMTDLTAGFDTQVDVRVHSAAGDDELLAPLTTASPAAPTGTPNMVATSSIQMLDADTVIVTVSLANHGGGDALKVQLGRISIAGGWRPYSQAVFGVGLPPTLDVGDIGAAGAGSLAVLLVRVSGNTDPKVTVRGIYTDAAGNQKTF